MTHKRSSYEEFYSSLWDAVQWPLDQKSLAAEQITDKISQYAAVISKISNMEGNASTVTRQQWAESLAVASSFTDFRFSWTTEEMRKRANGWISTIAEHLGIDPATLSVDSDTFRIIYTSFVRPYFVSNSQRNTVGQQSAQQQNYVLMGEGATSKSGNSGQSDDARWRKHPQCIATFSWALSHLREDAVASTISSMLPVVLALMEDYECQAKLWGLRMATALLGRQEWTGFLRKSGIVGVIDKSVRA
ncbi:hypothetical protein GGI22_005998, partial [Coemansia erecta]